MKTRALLTAACAIALAIGGASGCGGGGDSDHADQGNRYVTQQDIARYPPNVPMRAALEWWRAVQFRDVSGALAGYAPGRAPSSLELRRQIGASTSSFSGVPALDTSVVRGRTAALYLFLTPPGSGAQPRPLSLRMIRGPHGWGLANNELMEEQVARVARALRNSDSG